METVAQRPKSLALVGGGKRAKAFLEVLAEEGLLGSVLGVADPEESAPGVRFARQQGIPTCRDFRDLYRLPGLEVLLELTGDDRLLAELLRTRPAKVAVIDDAVIAALAGAGETALRESEERFRDIASRVADWIWEVDTEGIYTYSNPVVEQILGYRPEQIVGHSYVETIHPEERDRCRQIFAAAVRDKAPFRNVPHLRVRADGSPLYLETSGVPLLDERGKLVGFRGIARDITERQRAEEALREAKERFRVAFEEAPIGMALAAPDGHFLDVNRAMCRMLGYSRQELLGADFGSIVHPDDVEASLDHARRALAGEFDSYRLEKRYLRKDGRVVWALLAVSLVRDSAGTPLHMLGQVEDITERKRAEEALEESERRYRALVDNALVGVFQTTLDGRFLYANQAMAAIAGYGSPEEMYGIDAREFWGEPSRRQEFVAELKARGRVSNFEVEGRRRGGERGTVLISASLRGELIEGMLMDITERKRAEAALRGSEERYRLLVENSPDCIKLLDLEGRYLAINRAGIEALGRPLEEILGRKYPEDLDPDDRPAVRQAIAKAASGEVVNLEAKSGPSAPGVIWSVTLVPLRSPEGKVDRLLGCSRDVTEERRAAEAMRQAAEELERAGRLKDEFLSMASHELKTPVTSIKVYSELALKRPEKAAPRLPEILATIDRQADHLVSLINDLLDVSRLQLDRVRLEFERCDLRDLLDDICRLSRELYADHPLNCEPPAEPVFVRADRSRLVQVLQNLIDNASKYSPPGSPIDVEIECGLSQVTIAIRDRGAGIAPEDLPHIFERFYKPKRQQAVLPGLGLGLYISRELVIRHGGRIWAESQLGQGSTFHVELPLAQTS